MAMDVLDETEEDVVCEPDVEEGEGLVDKGLDRLCVGASAPPRARVGSHHARAW